jgi:hypothetical protein
MGKTMKTNDVQAREAITKLATELGFSVSFLGDGEVWVHNISNRIEKIKCDIALEYRIPNLEQQVSALAKYLEVEFDRPTELVAIKKSAEHPLHTDGENAAPPVS